MTYIQIHQSACHPGRQVTIQLRPAHTINKLAAFGYNNNPAGPPEYLDTIKKSEKQGRRTSNDAPRVSCRRMGSTIATPLFWKPPVHRPNRPWIFDVAVDNIHNILKACSLETTIFGVPKLPSVPCWHWTTNIWCNVAATNRRKR